MKMYFFDDPKGMLGTAEGMLESVLEDPQLREHIEKMVANPKYNRREVFANGWVFGVTYALNEVIEGRLRPISKG